MQQRADGWLGSRPSAQGRPGRRPGDDPHPDLPSAGRIEASALFGLIRAEAIQNGERGCTWQINTHPTPRLPKPSKPGSTKSQPIDAPWPQIATAAAEPQEIDEQVLKDALDRTFEENEPLTPKRTRGVVVLQNSWVISERYAQGIQAISTQ